MAIMPSCLQPTEMLLQARQDGISYHQQPTDAWHYGFLVTISRQAVLLLLPKKDDLDN
ncbi:unnamed protein product [Ixodes persulcatus]